MNTRSKFYLIIIALFLLIIINGCGSSASSFYMLTPVNNYQPAEQNVDNGISIGISTIEFPDYLRRPQIVTYKKNNEVYFDEFNRWAESLQDNFTNVLLENLSYMIPTNNIYMFMWPEDETKIMQIIIKIDQFGLVADSKVVLNARWSISPDNNKIFLTTKKANYQENISSTDYNQIVAAMSKLTSDFSKDIASAIKREYAGN